MNFTQPGQPAVGSVLSSPLNNSTTVCLSYHGGGQRLYVAYGAAHESRVQVVDCLHTGKVDRPSLRLQGEHVRVLQASHHQDCVLYAADGADSVQYYSVHDNKILRKFRHAKNIHGISQNPADDTFLSSAVGSGTPSVRLWTLQSAGCLAECKLPANASATTAPLAVFDQSGLVFGLAAPNASNNNYYLHLYDARNYTAGAFAELQVDTAAIGKAVEAATGGADATHMATQPWESMCFNAAGNQILVTGQQGLCLVLDGYEGTVQSALVQAQPTATTTAACFSSDDQYVLAGQSDGNIDVWSVSTTTPAATLYKTLTGHPQQPVQAVAANPVYAQFASASARETALWIGD